MARRLAALLFAHVLASYFVVLLDLARLASWEGYERAIDLGGSFLRAWLVAPVTSPFMLCGLAWYGVAGNQESLTRAAFEWPTYLVTLFLVYRKLMNRWGTEAVVADCLAADRQPAGEPRNGQGASSGADRRERPS